jgi:YidC/Oxa1 family membrane protein insertase
VSLNPWTLLLQALGGTLAFFYSAIPNYGIAIILLTVVVSLLLFPLTLKQTRSMKAMQEIQPDVKRLQKELKGDREELNKQLMALYQERGVNPAAGCLPLLLQMPIWFALFRVLRVNVVDGALVPDHIIPDSSKLANALVEGRTGFLGMDLAISPSDSIGDGLVAAIPYLILIALVIVFGFYQQYQTTRRRSDDANQSPQAQGMQTAMKIMPLVLGFVSWGFPTGLVLYFAVSSLFRIGQQAVMLNLDERDARQGTAGKATPVTEPPPPAPRKGPAPNTSKKRKQRRRK